MDYHQDRFKDYSLMVYQNDMLIAALPANRVDDVIHSHQGLTYGGFILNSHFDRKNISELVQAICAFLKKRGINYLRIKEMPSFYLGVNFNALEFRLSAYELKPFKKERVLAIDYGKPFTIHKTKRRHFRKNQTKGFVIKQDSDFSLFWNSVLCPRLAEKHKTKPVHTLEEIMLLKSRFPNQIKQYNIYFEDQILAGITIFDTGNVVKSQYGATTAKGEQLRALEYLFLELIYKYKDDNKAFFSMGTVTENNELGYNEGLLKQKEELGCSIYFQDFYDIKVG